MESVVLIVLVAIIGVVVFVIRIIGEYNEGRSAVEDLKKLQNEYYNFRNVKYDNLKNENDSNLKRIADLEEAIHQKDELYKLLESSDPRAFAKIASLVSDFQTMQYDISARYLENKKHPAIVEAQRIRELKENTKGIIYQSKLAQYKYEHLFALFPDLELYVGTADEMEELKEFDDLSDFQDFADRTKKYLTKEEYQSLPEDKRNQLALDRYVERQKSKWQIGRDYELFIGYLYSLNGWDVEYFGIEKQLSDMGRDLIAKKPGMTEVIQCKYWSQIKTIHEKHIAQLYGTTVQYMLSNKSKRQQTLFNESENVVPVFITNIELSETAREFAEYLDVKVIENRDFEEFPRIKCNINRDEFGSETKIYHLPMDQQYDRTRITKVGECFAFTVEEAVRKGFRRAYKWLGNR